MRAVWLALLVLVPAPLALPGAEAQLGPCTSLFWQPDADMVEPVLLVPGETVYKALLMYNVTYGPASRCTPPPCYGPPSDEIRFEADRPPAFASIQFRPNPAVLTLPNDTLVRQATSALELTLALDAPPGDRIIFKVLARGCRHTEAGAEKLMQTAGAGTPPTFDILQPRQATPFPEVGAILALAVVMLTRQRTR